jgi:hypothetical protein
VKRKGGKGRVITKSNRKGENAIEKPNKNGHNHNCNLFEIYGVLNK